MRGAVNTGLSVKITVAEGCLDTTGVMFALQTQESGVQLGPPLSVCTLPHGLMSTSLRRSSTPIWPASAVWLWVSQVDLKVQSVGFRGIYWQKKNKLFTMMLFKIIYLNNISEGKGETRGAQLAAVCNLTARSRQIPDIEPMLAILSDCSWEIYFVIALSRGQNYPKTPETPLWFSKPQNCWLAGKTRPLPRSNRPSFLSHFIPNTHRTESAIITCNLRVATHTLCLHSYTTPMGLPSGPLKQATEYWLQALLLLAPSLSLI